MRMAPPPAAPASGASGKAGDRGKGKASKSSTSVSPDARRLLEHVHEFLLHLDMKEAAAAVEKTCRQRRVDLATGAAGAEADATARSQAVTRRLGEAFLAGDRVRFVSLWERFVPQVVRRNDPRCFSLEFFAQVFFSIYPIHPVNKSRLSRQQRSTQLRQTRHSFHEFLIAVGATYVFAGGHV